MRRITIFFTALLFSGCNFFYNHIEITGTTPGINSGMVLINDPSGKMLFGEIIHESKFHVRKQALARSGYYRLSLTDSNSFKGHGKVLGNFEIYLEPGTYTISTGKKGMSDYPIITSSSKIQNELSAYYLFADSLRRTIKAPSAALLDQLNSPDAKKLSQDDYMELVNKVKDSQTKENQLSPSILEGFIKRYPRNEISAHIMANWDYEAEPITNYKIFNTFSETAKNSEDGQEIGDKLSHLVKLMPGALASQLEGLTPDGKPLNLKAMNKKVILVEFWEAGIMLCRKNHQQMVNGLMPNLADKGFGIISVCMDDKRDWWTTAIKDDKMTWAQVSDGKGLNSPNLDNWGISDIPAYCLIDGSGHIIEKRADFGNLMFTVNDYLAKHP